jgi:putative AdoMet-dependent methyltransferase
MRSQFVDKFNHDPDAAGYDVEVRDEADPIRAGYEELLRWVAGEAGVLRSDRVIELGSGTGNLTALLGPAKEIVCVDVSREMNAIARDKVDSLDWATGTKLRWLEADLLEALELVEGPFDAVASTYAVHHLTDDEKVEHFAGLRWLLGPGGRAVFGDLAFESQATRFEVLAKLRAAGDAGSLDLAETIEDEFFWDLERATSALRRLGFAVRVRRFSELSWGVAAVVS